MYTRYLSKVRPGSISGGWILFRSQGSAEPFLIVVQVLNWGRVWTHVHSVSRVLEATTIGRRLTPKQQHRTERKACTQNVTHCQLCGFPWQTLRIIYVSFMHELLETVKNVQMEGRSKLVNTGRLSLDKRVSCTVAWHWVVVISGTIRWELHQLTRLIYSHWTEVLLVNTGRLAVSTCTYVCPLQENHLSFLVP